MLASSSRAVAALALAAAAAAAQALAPPVPEAPDIDARAYVLLDNQSGQIIAARQPDLKIEPASLTKIMSIYAVAYELEQGRLSLDEQVSVSEKAWRMPGSRMFIEVGTKVSVEQLMLGDIVQSGNDASVALAEHISGSEEVFAALMNQHAHRLGLTATHYVNSTGLPHPEHYTSARDVARLGTALIRDFPDIYELFSIKEYAYNGIRQTNRNRLLWRDDSVDGIKTGYTESAGYCLAASAIRGGRRLVAVVAGASSDEARVEGTAALLNFGFRFYETHEVFEAAEPVTSIQVFKGAVERLELGLAEPLVVTIPRGRYEDIDASMDIDAPVLAPIASGQALGTLELSLDGERIARRPLTSLQPVAEGGFLSRMLDSVRLLME